MHADEWVDAFATAIGYFAIAGTGTALENLTIGFATEQAAIDRLCMRNCHNRPRRLAAPDLVARIMHYCEGACDDFADVPIAEFASTPFAQRVLRACRDVPYGRTVTYRELAEQVGSPGAARAVGNCMASNRIPLIIPCHRVVPTGGGLGGYSGGRGVETKQRLLELEGVRQEARHDSLWSHSRKAC